MSTHEAPPASEALAEVRVRAAVSADFAAIDALIDSAYAHDYGPRTGGTDPMHRAAERAREHDVWVAVDAAGTYVGSVTTRRLGGPPLHEDVADDELDLRLLGVSPAARRRGVAASLMRDVAARAEAQGWRAVVLKTAPDMRGAHRLYEALGYARQPERDGLWIGGKKVIELFNYALPLGVLRDA
ncbi:putative acetyltransferase [Leucobacter sp. 7(1)]|uniref:GNAT family N-acetyltransferase n=1 Tax=Leucobacter sp. 7(1) TaxID=1255613 RepID=UPI00097E7C49|nr:GNAT family N-acetyltransferase [Leucobacter sp. 7(1)]SJN12335.1 putative acetyltransferase [Leucobacter sp. 7(1)]